MARCRVVSPILAVGGCDPIINIYGSFFPAWVVCLVAGVLLTVLLRFLFAATGVEQYLGPLVLIYPSLTLLLTLVTWLILFPS
jgi:YtcA family